LYRNKKQTAIRRQHDPTVKERQRSFEELQIKNKRIIKTFKKSFLLFY